MEPKQGVLTRSILLLVFTALLGGCLGSVKPPDPIYFYTLDYASPGPRFSTPVASVLRLERFSTSPPYNSQRMIYSDDGAHRNSYAYHQWITAPGDLLPYLFARDLDHTNGFQAVFTPDSTVRATHSVHGWIEQFLERDTPSAWIASVIVHITLFSNTASDPTERIMMQQRYSAEVNSAAKTPAAIAQAMGQAVSMISQSVSEDIYQRLSE